MPGHRKDMSSLGHKRGRIGYLEMHLNIPEQESRKIVFSMMIKRMQASPNSAVKELL
jgi:hypothetical protein